MRTPITLNRVDGAPWRALGSRTLHGLRVLAVRAVGPFAVLLTLLIGTYLVPSLVLPLLFVTVMISVWAGETVSALATVLLAMTLLLLDTPPNRVPVEPTREWVVPGALLLLVAAMAWLRWRSRRHRLALERHLATLARHNEHLRYRSAALKRNLSAHRTASAARVRHYHDLFETAPDALLVLDTETERIVEANRAAREQFGGPRRLIDAPLHTLSPIVQPDGAHSPTAISEFIKAVGAGETVTREWWHRNAKGRDVACELTLTPLPDHGERRLLHAGVRDADAIRRERTVRAGEQRLLRSIAEFRPLQTILDTAISLVESVVDDSIASVLLLDAETGAVRHGASSSLPPRFRDSLDGLLIGPRAGSCGTAMWRREPVIAADIETDPLWEPYRDFTLREGLRACWSVPILGDGGVVLGSLAIYRRRVGEPVPAERELMTSVASFVAIGIERHHAEAELRRSEAVFRMTFEQAAVGIGHLDDDGCWLHVNPRLGQILGVRPPRIIGTPFLNHVHPDERKEEAARLDNLLHGSGDAYRVEQRFQRTDDDIVWVNLYVSAVRRDDGSVERLLCVVEDVSEAHYLSEELSYQARHDSLTGLINRHEFERQLAELIGDVNAGRQKAAVCFLDLDQFKLVNDTAGHGAGDELLRRLSRELVRRVRSGDGIARLGGDEFGLLLRGCEAEDAIQIAQTLRDTVDRFRFQWGIDCFRLGVSIGVVPLSTQSLMSVTEALRAADSVCYAAKDQGRNRVVVWSENDATLFRRHGEMQWVPRLTRALEENRFVLCAQPIWSLHEPDAPPAHYELLLRLDEDGHRTLPSAFLPAAKRYSLTTAIDLWVLHRTLDWLRAHDEELPDDLTVSVNLSGSTVVDTTFSAELTELFANHGTPARPVCLEITEAAAVGHLDHVARLMETLGQYDCRFALDDFGSGFSSFAYFKTLPVDYIKIDGLLVRDIAHDPVARAVVESIVHVARIAGHCTIAESVENEAVFDVLAGIGVDYAQGYWSGGTVPLDELVSDPGGVGFRSGRSR